MKYEAISIYSSEFAVSKMCSVLEIRQSGYYQWLKRLAINFTKRQNETQLIQIVKEVFQESNGTYGYRRMQKVLAVRGQGISEYKAKRIMRENGLYPVTQQKRKPYTKQKADGRYSEDQLQQKFAVPEPDKVWAGDITYIKSRLGWIYLAIVMDLFNREIIGYAVSRRIDTELVKRALAGRRLDGNLIFHSDRGAQYSSSGFAEMLIQNKIQGSMSKAGCPYDNSCVESFFATTKKECIYRREYSTMEEIEQDLFAYIQLFYNRKRIHSTLGYLSPVEYRLRSQGGETA